MANDSVEPATFPKLLLRHARQRGDHAAIREKSRGIWRTTTWRGLADDVAALVGALAARGLERGAHVAFVGGNRPRLYAAMCATQWLGGVVVPLFQEAGAESCHRCCRARRLRTSSPRIRSRSTSCSRSCPAVRACAASFTTRTAAYATTSTRNWSPMPICSTPAARLRSPKAMSCRRSLRVAAARMLGVTVFYVRHYRPIKGAVFTHARSSTEPKPLRRWTS